MLDVMFSNCYHKSSLCAGTVLCTINLSKWWGKERTAVRGLWKK